MDSPRHTTIGYLKDALPPALEASSHTALVTVATLGATCLAFLSQPEVTGSQLPQVQTLHMENNCHTTTIQEGSNVDRALSDHLAAYPEIGAFHMLESFFDYAASQNHATSTKLPKTVLSVCLSPDGNEITSITNGDLFRK